MPATELSAVAPLVLALAVLCAALAATVVMMSRRHARALAELRRVNCELDQRRRDAVAATEAKSAFLAMVSHELRTPLSGVLAAGEELQARLEKEQNIEAIDVMVDAGRFMHTLLDDLLDLAKLEAGRMTVEKVDFDLGDLVWTLARHWSAAARRSGKPMQLTSALGMPGSASADPTRLRQILNNLLSNALKFTFDGRITVSLRAETSSATSSAGPRVAVLRVTDTGTGVAKEDLPRLFERFYRAEHAKSRSTEGSGIGLALVRELVGLHGGTITVQSTVDVGTTFTITLPFGCEHLPAKQLRATAAQAAPSTLV